jgi:hypothetical protein
MDAAGKDGAISHLLTGINPQGCDVHSFKHRARKNWITTFTVAHIRLPERGRIGVFNRSITRKCWSFAYPEILQSQSIPDGLVGRRQSGRDDTVPSSIWRNTSTATAPGDRSSCASGTNSASAFSNASTNRARTGSSAGRYRDANSGVVCGLRGLPERHGTKNALVWSSR